MGGRRHGQTQNQAELPSPSASVARFGSLQIGCAQQPRLARLAPRLRVRHRPIYRLVLLRASVGLQPHRSRALPHVPGITRAGRKHHQPAIGCRAPPRTRGRRLRLAQSRVGCGDQPSERSQATRVSLWQLVKRRGEFGSTQVCSWKWDASEARLRHAGLAGWVWFSQIGTCRPGVG